MQPSKYDGTYTKLSVECDKPPVGSIFLGDALPSGSSYSSWHVEDVNPYQTDPVWGVSEFHQQK